MEDPSPEGEEDEDVLEPGVVIDFSGQPVKILVGKRAAHFFAPQTVLVQSSDFLKAALSAFWYNNRAIRLPTVDAELFNVYLNWLHRNIICLSTDIAQQNKSRFSECDSERWTQDELRTDKHTHWYLLFRLYVLGDFLCDRMFKDAVIDTMILHESFGSSGPKPGCLPSASDVKYLWEAGGADVRIKDAVVDVFLTVGSQDNSCFTEDFPFAFLLRFAQRKTENEPETFKELQKKTRTCWFHEHVALEKSKCYRTRPVLAHERCKRW